MTKKKKNTKVAKGAVVNIRCTAQQKSRLEAVAARDGLGLSTWLLHAGLLAAERREAAQKEAR